MNRIDENLTTNGVMNQGIALTNLSNNSNSSNNSKRSKRIEGIKTNPSMFYSNLDVDGTPTSIEDIFALVITWCNDQASIEPSLKELTPMNTTSTIESNGPVFSTFHNNGSSNFKNAFEDSVVEVEIIPNHRKGTVEFHYDLHRDNTDSFDHNYVELCIDSDMLFNYLLNSDGDRTTTTDPFFAKVCHIFFHRNCIRLGTLLMIYNVFMEVLKGNMAANSSIASGYYGNAVGATCVLWIYGWGYYIFQGTIYKKHLMEGDENRTNCLNSIKYKLQTILDGSSNEYSEADLKYLLEEAHELGVSSFNDPVIEQAIHYNFDIRKRHEKPISFYPDIVNFLSRDEGNKLSAKIGYYEMLDVAEFLVVFITGFIPYWNNWYSCSKHGHPLDPAFDCKSVEFGMKFQVGYFLFAMNLWLGLAGVVVTLTGLMYGAFVCHNLVDSFLRRYKMLRKLKIQTFDDTHVLSKQQMLVKSLTLFLKRDCYERYILMKNLMEKISVLWSSFMVTIILVSTIFSIYLYAILILSNFSLYGTIAMLALAIFCSLTPSICCSYANSAMDKLFFSLKTSGPDDYAVVGGRDNFIQYATNTPCYWYVFGFAITPSWLAGFIGGSASAIAMSVLITKLST